MLGARLTELPVFPTLLLSAVKRLGLYLLCSLHGGSNGGARPRTGANALHFHPARTRKVVGNNQSTSCDSESRGSESLMVEGPLLRARPLCVPSAIPTNAHYDPAGGWAAATVRTCGAPPDVHDAHKTWTPPHSLGNIQAVA